jgi:ubiquinone/menaquinone biosynthesis C-methylase UbiE
VEKNYWEFVNADLQRDTDGYFKKYIEKSEQQKFLEGLLGPKKMGHFKIADVACGGGTLSYHLKSFFPNSDFHLYDYYDNILSIAKEINKDNDFHYGIGNIYQMEVVDNMFDYTFCWQTLSWIDEPQKALIELIRITKNGGKIYLSSLFNIDHDVDIYSKLYDNTREAGEQGIGASYNTYAYNTIRKWICGKIKNVTMHKFEMGIDLPKPATKWVGTYTRQIKETGERLQISAGLLMNWGILEITK